MRNIKLVLEYDGTEFSGWQLQPKCRTVQGETERALRQLTQEPIRVVAAGRTDTGVHACGQVVNFTANSIHSMQVFLEGGNALLPRDIRILQAEEVPQSFHARFDAKMRHYQYVISKKPLAIGRQYAWHVWQELDIDKMNEAAQYIQGEKDFKVFCQAGTVLDHYRCNVIRAEFAESSDTIKFTMAANRFLHNMVRIITGTFIQLGKQKMSIAEFQEILKTNDRRKAGPTAPPHGLFLVKVDY